MKRLLVSTILAVIALTGASAVADDGSDPAWASGESLFKEGLALVEQAKLDGDLSKYEEARRKFLAAYTIVHRPNVLFSAALAEKKLDRAAEAIHHFRVFLRNPSAEPKLIAQAKKMVAELSSKVASIRLEAPAGADIFVDGTPTGDKAPLSDPLDLAPGRHSIEARRGTEEGSQAVDAAAGTNQVLQIELAPAPPSPPPPTGPAPTPPALSNAPLSLSASPARDEVHVSRGSTSTPARVVTSLALAGAGIVALGAGTGFYVAAGNAGSRAAALNPQNLVCPQPASSSTCVELGHDVQTHVSDTNIGAGFVIAGAVLVGGGLAAWLLWPKSSETTSFTFSPILGDHQAGGTVVGHF